MGLNTNLASKVWLLYSSIPHFMLLFLEIASLDTVCPLTQICKCCFVHLSFKSCRKKGGKGENNSYKPKNNNNLVENDLCGYLYQASLFLVGPRVTVSCPLILVDYFQHFLEGKSTKGELPQLLFVWKWLSFSFVFEG